MSEAGDLQAANRPQVCHETAAKCFFEHFKTRFVRFSQLILLMRQAEAHFSSLAFY